MSKYSFDEQEEIDADKRALRLLLDSFHVEPEAQWPNLLSDQKVQQRIGLVIAQSLFDGASDGRLTDQQQRRKRMDAPFADWSNFLGRSAFSRKKSPRFLWGFH